jgi:hypothetical protein
MTYRMAFTARSFLLRLALTVGIVVVFALLSRAGGPKRIAGSSYFDPTVRGQALVWPPGQIVYFTDQGDLSPLLPNASANTMVENAFSQWTSVATVALAASSGGQLAEDVNGSNVTVNADGTVSIPTDIQPTASATPVGVVYDYDGSVTNALMGSGAGDASQCFSNAVFGGDDNFGSLATFQHALIVINGQCAQDNSQVGDVEYRLLRVVGGVLGVGWSQVNSNVLTGKPAPTSDDYGGFPVMHYIDPANCVPITLCYANPWQLAMDDVAAISRLYPVTVQNQASFPGKQVLSAVTARIHGSVWFTDRSGNRTQAMQGVNVVARWIDPTTGKPSRRYAASSVSGFLFSGNEGNSITGTVDELGEPYSEWGSNDTTVEGFFDLGGLQLPNGGSAQYQLSVEGLDPTWSVGVGPYAPYQVAPSGSCQPVAVTVSAGQDVQQDMFMLSSALPVPQWSASESWSAPAPIPAPGEWLGSLSPYGDAAYFLLAAQANRTLSVAVTALDESGNASMGKAQPVIGMWAASDPAGTAPPAFTPSPFNTSVFGLTRLDADVAATTSFVIGISDLRGDGRPDDHYRAHVLYADSALPARLSANGGAVTVQGTGFAQGLTAAIGRASATPLAVTAGQMVLAAPAFVDGPQSITITDPASGASSTMTNVLTFGAAASDNIFLRSAVNPPTPVGTQAGNPLSVQVLAADNLTPVNGATIGWSATNGLQLSACSGAASCTVTTDQNGGASTWMTPAATGNTIVTATLAPGAYSSSKSVSTTLNGTESASDIGVLQSHVWIAQGATVSVPIAARVMSNGVAQNNVKVSFAVMSGVGTLSAASAQTSSTGYASVNLSLTQIAAQVQVSACVAPANSPCTPFYAFVVPLAKQQLQAVAGSGQVSTGQAFQPVVVRVVDSASPPDPVLAATVAFQTTVFRPGGTAPGSGGGAMPVILQVSQSSATSDVNGLASLTPSSGGFSAPVEVDVSVTAGTGALLDFPLEVLPAPAGGNAAANDPPSVVLPHGKRTEAPAPHELHHTTTSSFLDLLSAGPSSKDPPSRSPFCTTAGNSAAFAPSGLRRGNRAFLTGRLPSVAW